MQYNIPPAMIAAGIAGGGIGVGVSGTAMALKKILGK